MKKNLFILTFVTALGFVTSAWSQSISIKGRILDKETSEPIPFATFSLYSADSSLITGGIADMNGAFEVSTKPGSYYGLVQVVSYRNQFVPLRQYSQAVTDLGKIELVANVQTLNEVVVSAERSLMQMDLDKRIFNVSEDLSNVGRNAVEILDNLPSIVVDQDGGVSLRGSQNVRILIDGKPSGLAGISSTDALQALQGSMIERIEVVTNPSVRYEAEGNAGIINIILKKERQDGLNAVIEGTIAHPLNTGISTTMNFRKKKMNYFLNYSSNYRERPGRASLYQEFTPNDTTYFTRSTRDFLRTGWSHNFRAGTDIMINDKNTFTAAFLVNVGDNMNLTDITYRDYDLFDELGREFVRNDREAEDEKNMEYTLSYEKLFDQEGRKLTFYGQYRNNAETEKSSIRQRVILNLYPDGELENPQRSYNKESEQNTLLQLDYIHPFNGGKGKFETGYRGTIREINTDYLIEEFINDSEWVNFGNFSNTFQYDENIQALYVLMGNHVGKISYELGLRMEYTDIRTELSNFSELIGGNEPVNNKSYANFFPSIHANYHINNNNSVQVSYSRRVSRPGFWSLNPFSSFSDARNIRIGNPDLDPEFTDSYETGYLANGDTYSFYGGIYYRYTTDVTERITVTRPPIRDTTFIIPTNLGVEQFYGFEFNVSKDFTKWWTINGNANFFRAITEGEYEGESFDRDTYTWNSRVSNRFTLGKRTNLQATVFYRAPQQTTQGRREAFYTLDLGFTKDIWKNKATFSLNVRDVFNTRIFRSVNEGDDFYFRNRFQRAFTTITASLVFRINQRQFGEKEEEGDGERNGFDQDFDN
ncbi:MAG: outer membrane beta-barrel family protein [Cyclobacteriaceae bacterium]|nr:MAG: outer membrane beta-barrel family protein [Cyclobacteriaceae bacterium]